MMHNLRKLSSSSSCSSSVSSSDLTSSSYFQTLPPITGPIRWVVRYNIISRSAWRFQHPYTHTKIAIIYWPQSILSSSILSLFADQTKIQNFRQKSVFYLSLSLVLRVVLENFWLAVLDHHDNWRSQGKKRLEAKVKTTFTCESQTS